MPRYSIAASTRVSGSSMLAEQGVAAALARAPVSSASDEVVDRHGLEDVGVRGLGGDVGLARPEPVEGQLPLGLGGVLELALAGTGRRGRRGRRTAARAAPGRRRARCR